MIDLKCIKEIDTDVYDAIKKELNRQQNNIELIASENFVSPAVLAACGSHLTNKYAEGYPGKRYYGGCEYVDIVENLAIDRACKLFGAKYANVQPHCGSSANEIAYFSLLNSGDTVLGMSLAHGGHLTHGNPFNYSGRTYNFYSYEVSPVTETIDYDALRELAISCKPKLIIAGASAYPRAIDFEKFSQIAKEVGAYLMVDMAHIAGLCATGLHQNPVDYADIVTTTTHKTLRGPRGGVILTNNEEIIKKVNKALFPGMQGGPLMHIIAGKAIAFGEALKPEFKEYQTRIIANAKAMEKGFRDNGIQMVSGGTDNHLILVKVAPQGRTGKEVEKILDRTHITVNKNSIPFDSLGPNVTSGIRVGTPAITTRGMNQEDAYEIATFISDVIYNGEDAIDRVSSAVKKLCDKYPLYANDVID